MRNNAEGIAEVDRKLNDFLNVSNVQANEPLVVVKLISLLYYRDYY